MSAAQPLSIALAHAGPVVLLVASGEVDAATVGDLNAALEEAVTAHERHVVVDGREISFIDSTGVSALVAGQRRLNRGRRRLALACPSESPLGRALQVSGLDRMFELHADAEAAVAALDGAPLLGR